MKDQHIGLCIGIIPLDTCVYMWPLSRSLLRIQVLAFTRNMDGSSHVIPCPSEAGIMIWELGQASDRVHQEFW